MLQYSYQARVRDGSLVEPYVSYEIFAADAALGPHSFANVGRVDIDPTASFHDAEFYPEYCWDGACLPTGAPDDEPAAAILGRLAESPRFDATLAYRTDRAIACRVEESIPIRTRSLVERVENDQSTTYTWHGDVVPPVQLSPEQRANAQTFIVSLVDPRSLHDPASFVRVVSASTPKRAVYRAVRESFEYDVGSFSHFSGAFVMPVEEMSVYEWADERLGAYIPARESQSVKQSPFFEPHAPDELPTN